MKLNDFGATIVAIVIVSVFAFGVYDKRQNDSANFKKAGKAIDTAVCSVLKPCK